MKKYFVTLVAVMAVTTSVFAQNSDENKVTISLAKKTDVLYTYIDNPLSISVSGVPSEKVSVTISQGNISKLKGGEYTVLPKTTGIVTISVFTEIDGQRKNVGSKEYKVEQLPVPIAKVFGKSGGSMEKEVLLAQRGVIADMGGDFVFDLRYMVTQFTIVASTQDGEKNLVSNTPAFTAEQKDLFASLNKGTKVTFKNIKARGPDGVRDLKDIVFTIN